MAVVASVNVGLPRDFDGGGLAATMRWKPVAPKSPLRSASLRR
jgi:hypothetical protein